MPPSICLYGHVGVDHQAAVDRTDYPVDANCALLYRYLGHHCYRSLAITRVAGNSAPLAVWQRRAPVSLGRRQLDGRSQEIAITQQPHAELVWVLVERGSHFVEKAFIGKSVWRKDYRAPGSGRKRNVGQQRADAPVR